MSVKLSPLVCVFILQIKQLFCSPNKLKLYYYIKQLSCYVSNFDYFKSFRGKRFKSVFWRLECSNGGGKVYVKDWYMSKMYYIFSP